MRLLVRRMVFLLVCFVIDKYISRSFPPQPESKGESLPYSLFFSPIVHLRIVIYAIRYQNTNTDEAVIVMQECKASCSSFLLNKYILSMDIIYLKVHNPHSRKPIFS